MIRVAVIDDEALVRSGFDLILSAAEDIEVVVTSDGTEAVAAIRAANPDVVLLDIRMPDVDGLQILSQLLAAPDPPIVAMLTTFAADEYIADALRRGASGFLLKDTDPHHLASMVRALASGAAVLSPKVTKAVVNNYLDVCVTEAPELVRLLSDREREVIVLVAQGLSNVEISVALHLSIGTVKDAVGSIFTKFDVCTRVQAALIAERAGIVPREPR